MDTNTPTASNTRVAWTAPNRTSRRARFIDVASKMDLFEAQPSRAPHSYPGRRHYTGYYWMAGTECHVWHESLLEREALMWLDHLTDIAAISAQPAVFQFINGSAHHPDYAALTSDGRRLLLNVKPPRHINDDNQRAFDRLTAVAKDAGWQHTLFTGTTLIARHNLELIASARHPRYTPTDDETAQIMRDAHNAKLHELIRTYRPKSVLNLIWTRALTMSLTEPLTASTTVELASTTKETRR